MGRFDLANTGIMAGGRKLSKIYKYEVYLIDTGNKGEVPKEDRISDLLENSTGCMVNISKVNESEEFEWNDDLKINHIDSTVKDYGEYFEDKYEEKEKKRFKENDMNFYIKDDE